MSSLRLNRARREAENADTGLRGKKDRPTRTAYRASGEESSDLRPTENPIPSRADTATDGQHTEIVRACTRTLLSMRHATHIAAKRPCIRPLYRTLPHFYRPTPGIFIPSLCPAAQLVDPLSLNLSPPTPNLRFTGPWGKNLPRRDLLPPEPGIGPVLHRAWGEALPGLGGKVPGLGGSVTGLSGNFYRASGEIREYFVLQNKGFLQRCSRPCLCCCRAYVVVC